MDAELRPNEGKNEIIEVDGKRYLRLPIRTRLVVDGDDIVEVAAEYGLPVLKEEGDILFISEKCVACTQKRAIPMKDIKPRPLAVKLSAHVTKTPCGIGLFCMAFGDGMAGAVGKRLRGIWKKPLAGDKTLGGSLACVIFAAVGSMILLLATGQPIHLGKLALLGIICGVLELPGKGLDNLTVPFGCMLAAYLLL